MGQQCRDQKKELIFSEFHDALFCKVTDSLVPLIGSVEGDEVAQEALFKVYLAANKNASNESFRASLKGMKPLVFVIAKNMALSRIRHKKVRERFHEVERIKFAHMSIKSIEADVINYNQTQMLLTAVNQLPPICRQVFIHRKLHGKSHAQIAQMLNISVKTVENHLAKGLKLCRQHLIKSTLNQSDLVKKRA